jgi:TPR repeat protein
MARDGGKTRIAAGFWTTLRSMFVFLALGGTGFAGQYEDGQAALSRHDYAAAFQHFRTPAEQGDARAQHWLGFFYYYGGGVPQNYALAAKWYLKAAEQGYDFAQADLALMYSAGKGVTQSYADALKWFRLAADHGNAVAQYNLGIAYANGFGVPQNYILAHMWFNLAVANTTEKVTRDEAARNRDILAAKMNPEQLAEAQRLATEWKPK